MTKVELIEFMNKKVEEIKEALEEKNLYEKSLYFLDMQEENLKDETKIARNVGIRLANTADEVKEKISTLQLVTNIENIITEKFKNLPIEEQTGLASCKISFDSFEFKNGLDEVLDDIAVVTNFNIVYFYITPFTLVKAKMPLDSETKECKLTSIVKVSEFFEEMRKIGYKINCDSFEEFINNRNNSISFSFNPTVEQKAEETKRLMNSPNA